MLHTKGRLAITTAIIRTTMRSIEKTFFRNFRTVYSEYYKRHLHLSQRRKFIELRENAIIIKITINEIFLTSSLAIFEPSTFTE